MPKEIISAAEALGESEAEGGVATAEVPATLPPASDAPAAEPVAPAPGFEAPPPADVAAPTAAEVLAQADTPVPPSAPVPTQAKESVIPAAPETIPSKEPEIVEPAAPVVPVEKTEWRFVKNIQFGEKMVFLDGTDFVMKSQLMYCRDAALAAKILAVAKRYNIVEQ